VRKSIGLSGRLRRSCRAKLLCPFGKSARFNLTEAPNVSLSPGEDTEADDAQNCSKRGTLRREFKCDSGSSYAATGLNTTFM